MTTKAWKITQYAKNAMTGLTLYNWCLCQNYKNLKQTFGGVTSVDTYFSIKLNDHL